MSIGKALKKAAGGIKKVAKKVEGAGSSVAHKVLPAKVYKAAAKVVKNPVFQTVALSVATAGIGAMAQGAVTKTAAKTVAKKAVGKAVAKKAIGKAVVKGAAKGIAKKTVVKAATKTIAKKAVGKAVTKAAVKTVAKKAIVGTAIKKAALSGAKKAAGTALVAGVAKSAIKRRSAATVKQINQNNKNYAKAGEVITTMTAASLPGAANIAAKGGNVQEQWVNSETFKDTVVAANDAAMRDQIKANLSAQGVPANQLDAAANAAISQLSTNAVETKKEGMGLGTMALIAVPILFAFMGG